MIAGCVSSYPACAVATSCAAGIHVGDHFYNGGPDPRIDRSLLGVQIATIVGNQPCDVCDENPAHPGPQEALGGGAIGAKVYAVKGYRPSFRVATLGRLRISIFERSVRFGRDMLDLAGKVEQITSREIGRSDHRVVITDPRRIAHMIKALGASRVGGPTKFHKHHEVTLHLRDGTLLPLDDRLVLPRDVVQALTSQ